MSLWQRFQGKQEDEADDRTPLDGDDAATREWAERIQSLPREIQPEGDLFAQIRTRIEAGESALGGAAEPEAAKPRGWREALADLFPRPLAAAGVGAGLMAATALIVFGLLGPTTGPLSDREIAEIAARVRAQDGVAHVQVGVTNLLEERRASLPPEALAAIEASLRDIDRAIAEIHLALIENPGHSGLHFLLAETYQREAQLLEQLEWWTAPAQGVEKTSSLPAREVLS